jgi:hypothetical protein
MLCSAALGAKENRLNKQKNACRLETRQAFFQ